MLTIKEAAKLYRMSVPTIYRWIQQDKIKSKIEYGNRYYSIDDLQIAYEKRHPNRL